MVNDFFFSFSYLLRRNLWSFVLKYCYCRCMPILQYYNLNALQQSESLYRYLPVLFNGYQATR